MAGERNLGVRQACGESRAWVDEYKRNSSRKYMWTLNLECVLASRP